MTSLILVTIVYGPFQSSDNFGQQLSLKVVTCYHSVTRLPNHVAHRFVNAQQLLLQAIHVLYDFLWFFTRTAEQDVTRLTKFSSENYMRRC